MTNIPSKKCKTLTEQYYDGTLPTDYYYFNNGHITYPVEHHQTTPPLRIDGIKVVCKIPEYEEYVELLEKIDELSGKVLRLEKELCIAVNTLKEVVVASDNYRFCQSVGYKNLANEALEQIKGEK